MEKNLIIKKIFILIILTTFCNSFSLILIIQFNKKYRVIICFWIFVLNICAGMKLSNLPRTEAQYSCDDDFDCQYQEPICKSKGEVAYCDNHICKCKKPELSDGVNNNDHH